MHTAFGRSYRGFTLLEALVALVLAGIVTAGVGLAFRTGLDAAERLRSRGDAHAEARGALEALTADLSAAFLSGVNTRETFFVASPPDQAQPSEPFLAFTTLAYRRRRPPDRPGMERSDAVCVEYSLEAPHRSSGNAGSGNAGSGDAGSGERTLLRRERWLTEAGPGVAEIVCERVAGLRLRYGAAGALQEGWAAPPEEDPALSVLDGETPGAGSSSGARTLPRAIEITLLLAPAGAGGGSTQPRLYRTTVAVRANGAPPFESETTFPSQRDGGGPQPPQQP